MLPDNCSVTRRNVKNARLRVCEDGTVQLFVPMAFTDEDVERLLEKKAQWIATKRQFFEQKSKIQLRRNELLLFGNRYAYFYSSRYQNKIIVNHESRTIQAKRNLLDIAVQEKWFKFRSPASTLQQTLHPQSETQMGKLLKREKHFHQLARHKSPGVCD